MPKIYNLGRGKGKTLRAVVLSEYFNIPIVCANQERAQFIQLQAREKGFKIPECVAAGLIKEKFCGKHLDSGDYLVDDAEDVLSTLVKIASGGKLNNSLAITINSAQDETQD